MHSEIWFRAISNYLFFTRAYVVTMRKIDHNILPLAGPDSDNLRERKQGVGKRKLRNSVILNTIINQM